MVQNHIFFNIIGHFSCGTVMVVFNKSIFLRESSSQLKNHLLIFKILHLKTFASHLMH